MEKTGIRLNLFNLIIGIVGGIVTITASIGGAYVTTQVVLAKHEEQLKGHDKDIVELKSDAQKAREKDSRQMEVLMEIRTTVAVINERTKKQ